TFNYHVQASQPGQFTIPEFKVVVYGKTVTVPAAQLEVSTSPPPSIPPAQRLVLQPVATNLLVGQPTKVRIVLPGMPSGFLPSIYPGQIPGDGFFVDQTAFRSLPTIVGTNGVYTTFETSVMPLRVGRLSAFAQAFTAGFRTVGQNPVVLR